MATTSTRNTTQLPSRNLSDTLLTHSITFEAFNEEAESFTTYRERLENFFTLRQLTGSSTEVALAKVQILINCLGSKYYQLISSLTAPQKPNEKTYSELILLLEKHLSPPSNVHTERHKFLSRTQHTDESIAAYVAALKLLLHTCKWICPNENCKQPILAILQAQFIRGLKDVDIREKILQQEETVNFDKTLEIALAIEAAKKQNREDYQKSSISVNRIGNSQKHTKSNVHDTNQRSRSKSQSRSQSTQKCSQIERLGLKNKCLACGKSNHKTRECRSKDKLHCTACNRSGHLRKVCLSTALGNQVPKSPSVNIVEQNYEDDYYVNSLNIAHPQQEIILNINSTKFDNKICVPVLIGNSKQNFEVDSGSPVTIMSHRDFNALSLNIALKPTNVRFQSYTKESFSPLGVATVPVRYNNRSSIEELYVVQRNYAPILGRGWIRKLGIINLNQIENRCDIKNIISNPDTKNQSDILIKEIFSKYADIFKERIGKIPNVLCSLKLKENAKPTYIKPRSIPYALLDQVNDELDSLENQGIIEKANYCQWGSPLVVVPKPGNQGVRLCADYKVSINPLLLENHYPIPKVEDLFNQLRDGNFFCVLDIHKAYLHVELDKESSHIAAILTHKGTYLAKRMFYGLKTAPGEFQKNSRTNSIKS